MLVAYSAGAWACRHFLRSAFFSAGRKRLPASLTLQLLGSADRSSRFFAWVDDRAATPMQTIMKILQEFSCVLIARLSSLEQLLKSPLHLANVLSQLRVNFSSACYGLKPGKEEWSVHVSRPTDG